MLINLQALGRHIHPSDDFHGTRAQDSYVLMALQLGWSLHGPVIPCTLIYIRTDYACKVPSTLRVQRELAIQTIVGYESATQAPACDTPAHVLR